MADRSARPPIPGAERSMSRHHRPDPPARMNRHQLAKIYGKNSSIPQERGCRPKTARERLVRSLTTLQEAAPFREFLKTAGVRFKELSHNRGSRYFYIRHMFNPEREAIIRFSDHRPAAEAQPLLASVDGINHTREEAQQLLIGWQNT